MNLRFEFDELPAMSDRKRAAFSLVELMVAIVLVLILMLGVSKVFTATSATVSAGQAISDNTRVARAAASVFADDFNHAITSNDAPFLVIRSSRVNAFRNKADDLSDNHSTDYGKGVELTVDVNGNNVEGEAAVPGERISAATYNYRSHRIDSLSFFVRGLYHRQTGNSAENMISPMSSSEAFVNYGPIKIWDGVPGDLMQATKYFGPADTDPLNANDKYATQFVLGRSAILLSGGTTTDANGNVTVINDANGTAQVFIKRTAAFATANLFPLGVGAGLTSGTAKVQESTCDLAGISLANMRAVMLNYCNQVALGTAGYDTQWGISVAYPFSGNPLLPRPLTAQSLAQTSPVFIPGCTQFIVEYAGDYLSQDPTSGAVNGTYMNNSGATPLATATDGKIDWVQSGTDRQIRWYGMPRDVDGDGKIVGGLDSAANVLKSADVIPLRDLWQYVYAGKAAPFEATFASDQPTTGGVSLAIKANYADTGGASGALGMNKGSEYRCAWGPNDPKPKMIRIIITLDDPAGRLPGKDGQTFEYVFTLP